MTTKPRTRRDPSLVVETINWNGTGLIRGVASSPEGVIYALRGHCVYIMSSFGSFEVYAGNPKQSGSLDGHRISQALFDTPNGLCVTMSEIYVCDSVTSVIRVIEGEEVRRWAGITSVNGWRDGRREEALFNGPSNAVMLRETLFVSDYRNNVIRMISSEGMVTTIGGGLAVSGMSSPVAMPGLIGANGGINRDNNGGQFQASMAAARRMEELGSGHEDGPFSVATFDQPSGLCVSPNNTVIVADSGSRRVRSIDMDEWSVTTIAGGGQAREDGHGPSAGFGTLSGITSSSATGEIYLVDFSFNRIRCIDCSSGYVSTLTGSSRGERDGPLDSALLLCPDFCTISPSTGTLFWTEYDSQKIRFIRHLSPPIVTISSSSFASFDSLLNPPSFFSSDFTIHIDHIYPNAPPLLLHSHILFMSNPKLSASFIQQKLSPLGSNHPSYHYSSSSSNISPSSNERISFNNQHSTTTDHHHTDTLARDSNNEPRNDQGNGYSTQNGYSNQNEDSNQNGDSNQIHNHHRHNHQHNQNDQNQFLSSPSSPSPLPNYSSNNSPNQPPITHSAFQIIKNLDIPSSTLVNFFRILYGAKRPMTDDPLPLASTYAHFTLLFYVFEFDKKWLDWCKCRFWDQLVNFDVVQLFELILHLAKDPITRDLLIPVVLSRLKSCKAADVVEHRNLLFPLAASDLDFYTMLLFQITGAAPNSGRPSYDVSADHLRTGMRIVLKQLLTNVQWKPNGEQAGSRLKVLTAKRASLSINKDIHSIQRQEDVTKSASTSVIPSTSLAHYDLESLAHPYHRTESASLLMKLQLPQPNFTITIDGLGQHLLVHDWLLYARWGYFKRMMVAGLDEVKTRRMTFPADFPQALLLDIVKFIYVGSLPKTDSLTPENCLYILEQAEEYNFVDMEREPVEHFKPLITHCRSIVFHPLTVTNILAKLRLIYDLGAKKELASALKFVAANLEAITKTPSYHQDVDSLPTELCQELLLLK